MSELLQAKRIADEGLAHGISSFSLTELGGPGPDVKHKLRLCTRYRA